MLRLGMYGIAGRMGREIIAAASSTDSPIVAGFDPGTTAVSIDGVPVLPDLDELLDQIDVLVDFTTPDATVAAAAACAGRGTPLVSGTTGLTAEHLEQLAQAATLAPIFHARNMSVGVSAVAAALPALVRSLEGYDIEIIETHHRHKVDAPSGTALVLAEAIAGALGRPLAESATYGREGHAPRKPGEIGIHAVRAGGNAGEHVVLISNDGEEIRLSHRAFSRRTFALGALQAARFIANQPPGLYGMSDLIVHS